MYKRIVTTTAVFDPGYPADRAIDRLAALGFEALDMALDYWTQDSSSPFLDDGYLKWAAALKRRAESAGIPYSHAHAPGEAEANPYIERSIRAASALGAGFIVLHPVWRDEGGFIIEDEETFIRRNADAVTPWLNTARESGVVILSENLLWGASSDPRVIARLVKRVDSPQFGWCYDTGHANCYGYDPGILRECVTVPLSVHIQDNHGDSGDEHLIPGDGSVNWPAFTEALHDIGYAGDCVLEAHHQSLEAPDERRDDILRRLLASARTLRDRMYKNPARQRSIGGMAVGLKSSLSKGLFSEGRYFISLTNEERRYLALDALNPAWEHQSFFSRTNYVQKHTVLFFNGNMIVKVIYEEYKTVDNVVLWKVYREYDTSLSTEDRKLLLPLTSRGRKKPVIPANVLAIQPLGCELYIHLEENHSSIGAGNLRNCQMLAIGEREKVRNIMSDDDFHAFMRYYIATCPNSYFERIAEIRSMKHQTVKFRVGDIFRCQTDREHYTYGIILGKTREIEKWSELPAQHSFRHLLTQPIIVRMYDAVMTDANMTAEQLSKIPLRPSKLCSDADIIWGTHKIVAHKELEPDDIQFQLHLSRQTTKNEHNTPFTSEILKGMPNDVVRNVREPISLYVVLL